MNDLKRLADDVATAIAETTFAGLPMRKRNYNDVVYNVSDALTKAGMFSENAVRFARKFAEKKGL